MQVEIGRARLQSVCQIFSSSGTGPWDHRHGHTPRSIPGGSGMYCSGEKHNQHLLFFFSKKLTVRAPLARDISVFIIIFVYNMYVQTISFAKVHRHPPCPPPRRKTGRASSPFSGGKKPWGGLPIPESGSWNWWERKEIEARPSSFPPSDPSATPTSTATAPPWHNRSRHREERRWKLPPQREVSGSEAYTVESSRADSACFAPNQTTHKLCVSPLVWCIVGTEEHTICNVICFRAYALSLPYYFLNLDILKLYMLPEL